MIKTLSRMVMLVKAARSAVELSADPLPVLRLVLDELYAGHSDAELRDLLLVLRVASEHVDERWSLGRKPDVTAIAPKLGAFAADVRRDLLRRAARRAAKGASR